MATVRKEGPLDSKGKPKTKEPIFGGPLGKAVTDFNYSTLKEMQTRANARRKAWEAAKAERMTWEAAGANARKRALEAAATRANAERRAPNQVVPKATASKPAPMSPAVAAMSSRVSAMQKEGFEKSVANAKNKPNMSPLSLAPKYTPAAAASKPSPAKPTASSAQTFGSAFAAARKSGVKEFEYKGKKYTTAMKGEAPKPAAKPAEPMTRPAEAPIAKMESRPAQVESKEPIMAKREVKIETPEKKKRLFAKLRERAKNRKPSGLNPMSGFSVATASDYLEGLKGKTIMGGGMVKKYAGGGKMDKKKAFMEMIAKLKAKKK